MRRVKRILFRVLLIFAIVTVAGGLWMREEIMRLWAVNTLFDEDYIVANFSNMDAAFLTVPVPRGSGAASTLPTGTSAELPA